MVVRDKIQDIGICAKNDISVNEASHARDKEEEVIVTPKKPEDRANPEVAAEALILNSEGDRVIDEARALW